MMFSIICMLAPTHWTKFVCADVVALRGEVDREAPSRRRSPGPRRTATTWRARSDARTRRAARRGGRRDIARGFYPRRPAPSAGRSATRTAHAWCYRRRSSRRQAARSRPARAGGEPRSSPSRRSRPRWQAAARTARARGATIARAAPRTRPRRRAAAARGRRGPRSRRSRSRPRPARAARRSRRRCRRVVEREGRRGGASPTGRGSSARRRRRGQLTRERAPPRRDDEEGVRRPPSDARRDDSAIDAALASIPMTRSRAPSVARAKDRPTIAGSEVDDDPVGAGDPLLKLADVDLGDPPAGHDAHRRDLHSRVSEAQLGRERPIRTLRTQDRYRWRRGIPTRRRRRRIA